MARSTTQVNLRLKPELRDKIKSAAAQNSNTVSKEIIDRIQFSFDNEIPFDKHLDSPATRGIINLLASVVRIVGNQAGFASAQNIEGATNWFKDDFAYQQVLDAVTEALELHRPKAGSSGNMPSSLTGAPAEQQVMYSGMGVRLVHRILFEIKNPSKVAPGPSKELAERLARDLGPEIIARTQPEEQNQ